MRTAFLPEDLQTPLWRRIEQRLQDDLASARKELEGSVLDDKPLSTVRLRARIGVYLAYLRLPEEVQAAIDKAQRPSINHDDGGF